MQAETTDAGPDSGAVDFWSRELLFRMDWKLLHQLTIRMIAHGGYEAKRIKIGPGGEGLYGISNGDGGRAGVYLAFSEWQCDWVPLDEVKLLYSRLRSGAVHKGVFVTAGVFEKPAQKFALEQPLELIDGKELLKTIRSLPFFDRDKLLHMITLGEFTCPSCPSCDAKMVLRDSSAPEMKGLRDNARFRESVTIGGDARFGTLVIERGANVTFENFAHADLMVIRGCVSGELVCQGTVDIHEGAHVLGSVAARSINLLPGGILDGEMKILTGGKAERVQEGRGGPLWVCRRYPRCKAVMEA